MAEKVRPLGICDLCGNTMPTHTHHGIRFYCSIDCRNAANSRAGAPIRSQKARERVRQGTWINPMSLESPESRREHTRQSALTGRTREVKAGTWRNPALSDGARAKLSRPRTHGDNPLLHRAFELMRQGLKLSQLPEEVRLAHNAYRRELAENRRRLGHKKP